MGKTLAVLLLALAAAPASAQQPGFFNDGFEQPGPTAASASRFLMQASFGPTLDDIARVQEIGFERWLDEQFVTGPTLQLPLVQRRMDERGVDNVWSDQRSAEWMRSVVSAPDQLRQRVAFALSQVLVVSDSSGGVPTGIASYHDVLLRHAFGNYRHLLEEVTLHPSMGQFLSMLLNRKTNQSGTIRPDENYAREIMQLFSVGLVQLNPDGTPVDGDPDTPGTQPVPTYDQSTISGFAAVFTGWNLSTCRPTQPNWDINSDTVFTVFEYPFWWEWAGCPTDPVDGTHPNLALGYREPMRPWNSYHQSQGAKQLLRYPGVARGRIDAYGVLASGGTARDNLTAALDNIFHHPNVGPFITRRLIQRLVTSNPTPDYVARVSAVFNDDNGERPGGARGILGAVVRAILLDPEARSPVTQACSDASTGCVGKLREPLLRMIHLLRAMDARSSHPSGEWDEIPRHYGAQAVLNAPSVFNFFSPDYAPPGPEIADRGLVAPEFQIATDTYLTRMTNRLSFVFWDFVGNPWISDYGWVRVLLSLDRDMAIAHDPAALVDRYSLLFAGGQLPPAVRQIIIDHVASEDFHPWQTEAETRRVRVSEALWLILVSPSAVIEK
jgi:uncharacterized protein (DUF1800 family)